MEDYSYLKLAINESQRSFEKGLFPAGAVIVSGGKVLSSKPSDSFPGYSHAEYNAIDEAFNKSGRDLSNATLHASMEPCLMCLTKAYWAGIRRIVFAIDKESVNKKYYEGTHRDKEIIESLNEKMEFLQIRSMETEALKIVETWENNLGNDEKVTHGINGIVLGGQGMIITSEPFGKVGRNVLCPCGSGKKYKKCCGK